MTRYSYRLTEAFKHRMRRITHTLGCDTQVLTRPLPDYALQHVFAQHGVVEYVRLQRDKRYGLVQVTARLLHRCVALAGAALGTDYITRALY